jgi:hypothetical protein
MLYYVVLYYLLAATGPRDEAPQPPQKDQAASGGEQLSSKEVSEIPLNKRDFSQLLLLAAGTMTDANGAANFTQQFAVNGQRGINTVFALDGVDTTDPEMGGATFSNFNVDAIEAIRGEAGVMPASIGHGAASFTDVRTKAGTTRFHGTAFEFLRNATLDARNFFDRQSIASPGRIPPFQRNEFGFTLGGPLAKDTFFFGQYQGFRQVLSTTQVLPVPTAAERRGENTTAFPGDTLFVPVSPKIAPVLARYPMPNDPQGPFGARTYATSSKVTTFTDQFSIRIDRRLSSKGQLFGRMSYNNVEGPLTNPSQTAIDPSFATRFLDHQRNAGITYTRTVSPKLVWEVGLGYTRSTPLFPTINRSQPAIRFSDGLYEAFNAPGGSLMGTWTNLYQLRVNFTRTAGHHAWRWGYEMRKNRDSAVFGQDINGGYTFGGGTVYSPVAIRSASGRHDIGIGAPLPDALSGLLTATPFLYTISDANPLFPRGDHMGFIGIRRDAYNFYIQDSWKIGARLELSYGLRYEINTPFAERNHLTSGTVQTASGWKLVTNLKPGFQTDRSGWGPRLAVSVRITDKTVFRAGASIMTILPNIWQENFIMGATPFVVHPLLAAAPGFPINFSNTPATLNVPLPYTPAGQPIYGSGNSKDVAPNTEIDVIRFERDLAALSPGRGLSPISGSGIDRNFRNGYIGTYTAGLEREVSGIKMSAAYVATVGMRLVSIYYPNSYASADPAFAPLTKFDETGSVRSGFGPAYQLANGSHSTYHALQTSVQKTSMKAGLGFQASYTFGKSIDDTSAVLGGFISGASGALLQTSPQDPWNARAEKAPSTFDVNHVFAMSLIQAFSLGNVPAVKRLGKTFTSGWQVLNMTTLTTGSPFTVYSGIQQTGVGTNSADRPDQIGTPQLSTNRTVREDYFGRGSVNASFFALPLNVAGGTGPNAGRFGTLGRNTFRGPGLTNFDFALIKDTELFQRGRGEAVTLQARGEFFNVFNLVNFGLPGNIVLGPGFGVISRTAGTSRQIQVSLKLMF